MTNFFHTNRRSASIASDGFTLIELLVVIGILAVLTALIFPLASSVIAKAGATQCLGKIRTVGLSVLNYAQDTGATPIFDSFGWQGRGLPTDDKSGANWSTMIITPGYAPRAAFFCPQATKLAPDMTNPNHGASISAYALALNGVRAQKLSSIGRDDAFDWDAGPHRNYYKPHNVPLVMEYMAVHPKGTINAFFCDGSARAVLNNSKAYGPVQFEPNPGENILTYIQEQ